MENNQLLSFSNIDELLNIPNQSFINIYDLIVNILLAALVCYVLSLFYQRYSSTLNNRNYLSKNFILLGVTATLVISIIKSSLALSLGLVGALSIVRFRAAIKEPEELAYLFLVIGIGLGFGSGNSTATIFAFFIILLIIYIHKRFVSSTSSQTILIFLELKNSSDDLSKAHKFIDSNFQRSQVKKFSVNDDKIELIFKANLDNEKNLEEIELALKNLDITDNFSFSEELIIN